MKKNKINTWAVLSLSLVSLTNAIGQNESIYYNAFKRIAGVTPNLTQKQGILSFAAQGDSEGLARLAVETPQFGYITALSIAEKVCNRGFDEPWNDCTFTLASAMVLDEDMREAVWGNKLATANIAGIAAVSAVNNNHYAAIPKIVDLKTVAVMNTQTALYALTPDVASGYYTFRKTGSDHFNAGTNRGPIEKSFIYALGVELKLIKDPTLPKTYIAGDVVYHDSLTNLDDPTCLGCHTKLDAVRGAFAFIDYVGANNQLRVTRANAVVAKYARNANQNNGFPIATGTSGYVTTSDAWVNNYKNDLGFRTNSARGLGDAEISSGNGAASWAKAVSESAAFSKHLAKLAIDVVCNNPDYTELQAEVGQVASHLEQNGYKMKEAFVKAVQLGCVPASN